MFPYFVTSELHVGPIPIQPFLILVSMAIAIGYWIGIARASTHGVNREQMSELALWVLFAGLLGAHLMKAIYSWPPRLGWNVFNGLASFGAFAGAIAGGLIFFRRHRIPVKRWFIYSDAGAFAVPFAWAVGRAGCYLIHDHPGVRTTSWLGVKYPGGTRYDLGLLEMLFLLVLGALFLILDRRVRPNGFYCTTFLLSYGVFRIWLDSLHIDPPRYAGWTVDQIAGAVMVGLGVACIFEMRRLGHAALPDKLQ